MSHRLHRLNLPYDKDDVYVTRFTVMLQYTHDIDKISILSVTISTVIIGLGLLYLPKSMNCLIESGDGLN